MRTIADTCEGQTPASEHHGNACFSLSPDDETRRDTRKDAECTTRDDGPIGAPATAADALRMAVKLALDAGDLDAAADALALLRRMQPRPVTALEAVRRRRDDDGGKR